MEAVLCTGNAHKIEELAQLLPDWLTLHKLPSGYEEPEENGKTFLANAQIKARAGQVAFPGEWSIADDSGICVDALDGRPGVLSARFAGKNATDADNNSRLLHDLKSVDAMDRSKRTARFICVLVAIDPNGLEVHAEGTVEGHIDLEPSGEHGFGYDPLFVPMGYEATFGVLGPTVKATLSHRARAAAALAELLLGREPL